LVYGQPVEISPLAKPLASDPRWAERFEIYIAGMECGDNWSEQNDPVSLLASWRRAYRADEADSGHFHTLDFDFIEALEHGMPPTTGIGPGIERMAMIFTEQENIDDVIFFPLMRPSLSAVNAEVFGIDPAHPPAPPEAAALALHVEEFESLCRDGMLRPTADSLTITPHLRLWQTGQTTSGRGASGHVSIAGMLPSGSLQVAGYKPAAGEALSPEGEAAKFSQLLDASLMSFLRKTFPACPIKVAPVVVESGF